ncbi:MAG: TlpA family protein disulfide reductase [Planctomycetes bacterium]|nr:TlpA family protein disulfide reductase [Planctomycetota bacterium]
MVCYFLGLALAVATVLLICTASHGAEVPTDPSAVPTLRLANGDYVAGQLQDSAQPGVLRWQGAAFTTPFDIALNGVSVVHFPLPAERPKPTGEYSIELAGGDLLFGSLVAFSSDEAEFDLPRFGRIHVQRANIRRMLRWRDGADLVYFGPNGLSEWDRPSPDGAWRQEAGHLVTDQDGATIAGNFGLPAQASIEFAVSWTAKPDFVLALGADRKEHEKAFRFEVWDRDLVILCETDDEADLASLEEIAVGAGRAHFLVYLDQERSRAIVFTAEGRQIADLKVSDDESRPCPGIRLINNRGNVRLEQLCIRRWNGEAPREVQADKSRIHRADGSIVYGEIQGFDAGTKEFIVSDDNGETRIGGDQVGSVALSSSGDLQPRKVRAVFQDGVRLSGKLTKVEKGQLWMRCPGVAEPLGMLVSELHALVVLDSERPPSNASGRVGRLEMEGVKLSGCLVNGSEGPEASCLVWHPRGSATAAALRRGVSGRIVYRELASPQQQTTTQVLPQRQRGGGVLGQLVQVLGGGQPSTTPTPTRQSTRFGPSLYLRTGDTIPCKVERIDEKGVAFESTVFDATFVTHEKIKAVELENRSRATKINQSKRDRLLTLPRIQKNNPPTHLIRSTSGDYLRARLIEMDDKTLTAEVRLETRQLPRQYVTRIIWMHEDELGESGETEASSPPVTASRVQALRDDGIRLTFVPEEVVDTTLSGTSDVLGACRVELSEVDQLLIGGAIEQAAPELAYQRWRLQHAINPIFVDEGAEPGTRTPGIDSALVGKPAPDFELETLDGEKFCLSDQKGKTIVLDFWATWCGPCIQIMPQLDRVVAEFEDQNVMLVAVNLQEAPERITPTLERLELNPTVVLDIDGVVAGKYVATAIPQTVIIDSNGDVARLFVGGGPQYADQLRDALQNVLKGDDEEETLP